MVTRRQWFARQAAIKAAPAKAAARRAAREAEAKRKSLVLQKYEEDIKKGLRVPIGPSKRGGRLNRLRTW